MEQNLIARAVIAASAHGAPADAALFETARVYAPYDEDGVPSGLLGRPFTSPPRVE